VACHAYFVTYYGTLAEQLADYTLLPGLFYRLLPGLFYTLLPGLFYTLLPGLFYNAYRALGEVHQLAYARC
jgi:hypothetical protein